jgi:hypothetical protein
VLESSPSLPGAVVLGFAFIFFCILKYFNDEDDGDEYSSYNLKKNNNFSTKPNFFFLIMNWEFYFQVFGSKQYYNNPMRGGGFIYPGVGV